MNIIELAKEAGLLAGDEAWVSPHQEAMERFAELVRAEALEEAAKEADEWIGCDLLTASIRGLK